MIRLIRSEFERANAPAVLAIYKQRRTQKTASQSSALYRVLGILWRCYNELIALSHLPSGAIVLAGNGHKYDEVFAEMMAAGYSVGKLGIVSIARGRSRIDVKALNSIVLVLPLMWRLYFNRRLRPYCEVLLQAQAFTLLLAQQTMKRNWLIIGDLSTYLIALSGACKAAGHKVIYWQYSYQDFKHMPAQSDIAVILNEKGRELYRPQGSVDRSAAIYWRPRPAIEPVRLDSIELGPFGAFLNVHADQAGINTLATLQRVLGQEILVRLHPNTSPDGFVWPAGLVVADASEPLEAFTTQISLAVCGNTQSQAKALTLGTPVVQIAGLDPLPFDHHEYVRNGTVIGIQSPEEFSFERICDFYKDPSYQASLRALMGPPPEERKPGLSDFLQDIKAINPAK